MKNETKSLWFIITFLVSGMFLFNFPALCQEKTNAATPLPDNVNKIVIRSCIPCHSNDGGLLSRKKLNFTEWNQYSSEEQKTKAEKIYSVLKKGKMPPKSARETRPDIIPTNDQIEIIKKWSELLENEGKQLL